MAKEKDYFWQMQGLTSFCKARADWLDFDRIHLSFVKHEGKKNNCKQTMAIEGAVKLHGSDGVLYLSELVLSGAAKKMAEQSKKEATNGFVQPFFTTMGGTVSSRSNKGQCMFRQFSVAAGNKSDYVFQMMTCAGEENATGGIQPVKGAKHDTIYVSLSSADLVAFARAVQMEVTAYRTAKMLASVGMAAPAEKKDSSDDANGKDANKGEKAASDSKQMLVIITVPNGIVNSGRPFATSRADGVKTLKAVVTAMLHAPQRYVCDSGHFQSAVEMIEEAKEGVVDISLTGKYDAREKATISLVVDALKSL